MIRSPIRMLVSLLLFPLLILAACQGQDRGGKSKTPAALRVLSYNIHHGEGLDKKIDLPRLARVIRSCGVELVALQEVDRLVKRSGTIDELGLLARRCDMHSAFGKFMDYQNGVYGLGILSKYWIESQWKIPLPKGKREPRSALAVRIRHPELGPLTFVCLHLDWLKDDEHRYLQATTLIDALRLVKGPLILAGDFNDRPGSRTIELFRKHFKESKKSGSRYSFPADAPDREIDYVFYRGMDGYRSAARVIAEDTASDHRPVLGEFWKTRRP